MAPPPAATSSNPFANVKLAAPEPAQVAFTGFTGFGAKPAETAAPAPAAFTGFAGFGASSATTNPFSSNTFSLPTPAAAPTADASGEGEEEGDGEGEPIMEPEKILRNAEDTDIQLYEVHYTPSTTMHTHYIYTPYIFIYTTRYTPYTLTIYRWHVSSTASTRRPASGRTWGRAVYA